MSTSQKEAYSGHDRPSPETPMGASPVDIAIAMLMSPLILLLFVATWLGHGLRLWR